jgi:predicted DsbA family dithiol-disulfide isomerase
MGNTAEQTGPTLEIYGDYVCPYSWLLRPVLDRVLPELTITLRRRAFELRPVPAPFPDEGFLRATWETGVVPIARTLGVEAQLPSLRPRTRKAHEAVAFADSRGQGEAMSAAVFRAYFAEGQDIGRIDVLARVATGVGLDYIEMRDALERDQFTEHVLEDLERASELGITVVPAMVLTDAAAAETTRIGWQSADDLREWLESTLTTVME